ncbi:MAG: precorrin-2 C(20)-methyltransferase [Clostridiales bacterium]|nr:precorrin-2 C(20)-methyltransferase [Clostridiales bacterium]
MEKGKAYGVGVGPGDPELMTLRACRLIRENDVIAVPGKKATDAVAYKIAAGAVPEIADKELVPIYMPMVRDTELIKRAHREAADIFEKYLDEGRNVVYITLGDSTIYCTFSYIQHLLEADGYETELVPGITSFCAAAAALNNSLTEWNEPLHVVPALHNTETGSLKWPGNYVLMKSANKMREVKEMLSHTDLDVQAVENCSMETEKKYRSLDEIPDDAGYFSLIIAKERTER